MSVVIKFYFTSSMLNMFRTLIHPSSGVCDFSIVSPHWPCVLVLMCVGVSVWLNAGGIRVAGWSTTKLYLSLPNGYHPIGCASACHTDTTPTQPHRNSVTVQNRTRVYMNFFYHKDLGNHLLQLCPKVVKHPVYISYSKISNQFIIINL